MADGTGQHGMERSADQRRRARDHAAPRGYRGMSRATDIGTILVALMATACSRVRDERRPHVMRDTRLPATRPKSDSIWRMTASQGRARRQRCPSAGYGSFGASDTRRYAVRPAAPVHHVGRGAASPSDMRVNMHRARRRVSRGTVDVAALTFDRAITAAGSSAWPQARARASACLGPPVLRDTKASIRHEGARSGIRRGWRDRRAL
jgi:hypothetical protein